MPTDDRKSPNPKPSPRPEKKDDKITDLPPRDASSGKDEQVKGGMIRER